MKNKQTFILLLFFAVAWYFWNTIYIYPIKLFVVMLHELSHGLMAIIFGGKIINIQIDPRIGGYCAYTMPPNWFAQVMIASAGYLGSMLWGGIITISAYKLKNDRIISFIIGLVILVISFFVIKTGELFGILACFVFATFMLLSARFLGNMFHDYMLKFIGLTSCLYSIIDIKDDLILRSGVGSDADQISKLTLIPSQVIGITWGIISIIIFIYILRKSIKSSNITPHKSIEPT